MVKRLGSIGVLVVLAALLEPRVAAAAVPTRSEPQASSHSALLDRAHSGRAALRAMDAGTESEAAARNRMSATRLRSMIEHDPTVWLGRDGKIFYRDTAADIQAAGQVSTATAPGWATYPTADSLTLHSKPGSDHTIYLDFDGYTLTSGQSWVSDGIPAGTYGGFTLDADSASFSNAELDYIQTVWRMVAEKYSPFDVDVTTQAPTSDALNRSAQGDTTWGTQVVITNDMNARGTVCTANVNSGCVGIAWLNVFNTVEPAPQYTNYFEPAWVYTKFTSGGTVFNPGSVANAAAHEIGHTLGLAHDRTTGTSYYPGHDNWFAIMGSSSLAIGQFNDGGYPDAVTDQVDPITGDPNPDDLDVIARAGAPVRTDDVPASDDLGGAASYSVSGTIERNTDTDSYTITRTCSGPLDISATGIGMGQALDIGVSLFTPDNSSFSYDNTSGADTSTNPDTPTNVDIVTSVPNMGPGQYTVMVYGVGVAGSTGYSSYGSLGQYNLTVSGCTGAAPAAPATVTATAIPRSTTASLSWSATTDPGDSALTGYKITGVPGAPIVVGPGVTSTTLTGLNPGSGYNVGVAAVNAYGASNATTDPLSMPTYVPGTAPSVSTIVHGTSVEVHWSPAANPGNAVLTSWDLRYYKSGVEVASDPNFGPTQNAFTHPGLTAGSYQVRAVPTYTADDTANTKYGSASFTVVTVPSAPAIGTPSSGTAGGSTTALARWAAPTSNGGATITGYRVIAYRCTASGAVAGSTVSKLLGASARSYPFPLPAGHYKFRVVAYNAVGRSPYSAYSVIVNSR